ncbi:MAG: histidinol-phosphatase [Mycobacteriaceae bacterium]|nr:histidinol-phosphatase [Mycobacteriaceae bacterium]MBV9639523.1 histidinol-phosphatase [Mycobacteriaceae bacterium]
MTQAADDLALALELADEADSLTMLRYGAQDLQVHSKPDMSPVTDADNDVEATLRRNLGSHRAEDSVYGEELGGTRAFTGRQWVIDPIDGTKNYVRGVPIWATLIALLSNDVPVVGVVSAPALQRRWWAAAGLGSFARAGRGQPRRLQVSSIADLPAASLSFSDLTGWAVRGLRERFIALTDDVWRTRAYGDFYSYCLLAEGAVDIALEPEVNLWDLAAVDILVREAGGAFTSLEGRPGPHGGSAVASNGLLQQPVLDRLRSR